MANIQIALKSYPFLPWKQPTTIATDLTKKQFEDNDRIDSSGKPYVCCFPSPSTVVSCQVSLYEAWIVYFECAMKCTLHPHNFDT